MAERILSTDALAFYVGQDTLLRILLSEEQASRTPSLPRIQHLQAHRRQVLEQLNELSSVALHSLGVDTARVEKADLKVSLDDGDLTIAVDVHMRGGGS